MLNIGFAYCFKEAEMGTTRGADLENNKHVGNFSTVMRVLTSKDGYLWSHFDKIDETHDGINNSSIKQMFINNHDLAAKSGKIRGQLSLEHIFGFCKTIKKTTKNLGFQLTFKTADLKNILYTTYANPINVTNKYLYLFVPIFIPSTETQAMFDESIRNKYTISFDSWYTERKVVNDGQEFQVHIGSAQNVNPDKCIIAAHQTFDRIRVPKKLAIWQFW